MNVLLTLASRMAATINRGMPWLNTTIWITIAIFAAIWGIALSIYGHDRRQLEDDSAYQLTNLVRNFEHDTTELFTRYDYLARHIQRLASHGSNNFETTVDSLYDVGHDDAVVEIADAAGNVVGSTSTIRTDNSTNISDWKCFQAQRNSLGDTLYIGTPEFSGLAQQTVFHLSRALRKPSGEFDGVILITLPTTTITTRYHEAALGRGGGVALIGNDDVLRAGTGGFFGRVGRQYRGPDLVTSATAMLAMASNVTDVVEKQMFDGVARQVITRPLAAYPMRVMVAKSNDAYDPMLRDRYSQYFMVISLLSILELIAGLTLSRLQQRASLSRAERNAMEVEKKIAEASANDKNLFLAVMSHEIRTPLNGVLGALELMKSSGLNTRSQKCLRVATESGESLLGLIDDILLFAKSEYDQIDLAHAPFSLKELCVKVHESMQPLAAKNKNIFNIWVCEEASKTVIGDSRRLRQVLINLIGNASKFTTAGSITLKVEKVRIDNERFAARVSVSDTGIGIPIDKQSLIFNRFQTLDSSYTRRTDGTGLGLAICDKLVRAMGSEIALDSQPGRGSTFRFDVNFDFAAVSSATIGDTVRHEEKKDAGPRLRVLLAEDNPTNSYVATEMLMDAGHEVRHAWNGREAVELAYAEHFDVILMDVSMPEMSGIQAASAIRLSNTAASSIPIIALTAHAVQGDEHRFSNAGMTGYLTKPVRRDTLLAALRSESQRNIRSNDGGSLARVVAPSEEEQVTNVIEPAAFADFAETRTADRVLKTINIFVTELGEKVIELNSTIAREDKAGLQALAHSTIGSGSLLGAGQLIQSARALELRCMAGEPIDWPSILTFLSVLNATIEEFSAIKCQSTLEGKLIKLKLAA